MSAVKNASTREEIPEHGARSEVLKLLEELEEYVERSKQVMNKALFVDLDEFFARTNKIKASVPDEIKPCERREMTDGRFVLRARPALEISNDQFFAFCQQNPELRMERTAEGDLIIMPPVAGGGSNKNFKLNVTFGKWVEQDGRGEGFDSSGGFTLPNGAVRSPDVAWVLRDRLANLTPEQEEGFLPLCPDFVIELRSPSDRLKTLQEKMEEYRDNGAQLGWLLDPRERKVHVYRPDHEVEILEDPETLSGEPELPGFVLNVRAIFVATLRRAG